MTSLTLPPLVRVSKSTQQRYQRVQSRLHSTGPPCPCGNDGRFFCDLEARNLVTAAFGSADCSRTRRGFILQRVPLPAGCVTLQTARLRAGDGGLAEGIMVAPEAAVEMQSQLAFPILSEVLDLSFAL
jgi:hypothetical protein